MPVNSISFNRFLGGIIGLFIPLGVVFAQMPPLGQAELDWLALRIYQNECNSNFRCLTSWNQGEDFPSLGIGHFIWYREGQQEIFEETFPALLEFMRQEGAILPAWLASMKTADSPWQTRESFMSQLDSPQMLELREFLNTRQDLQAQFIAWRALNILPKLLEQTPPNEQLQLKQKFSQLTQASPPLGLYAIIDYVHFKGTGLNPEERYNHQGWGLLQVLATMEQDSGLPGFVTAASSVLSRRVNNAPASRNEARWLKGWTNRLQTYLP